MAADKTNARNFVFAIEDPATPGSFLTIKGVNTFTKSHSTSEQDTSDFDSDGNDEHMVSGRGRTVTVEGFFMVSEADGLRDPGQAAVEEHAQKIGPAANVPFHFYHKVYNKGQNGTVSCRLSDQGGGTQDLSTWGAEFKFSGAAQEYTYTPPV